MFFLQVKVQHLLICIIFAFECSLAMVDIVDNQELRARFFWWQTVASSKMQRIVFH